MKTIILRKPGQLEYAETELDDSLATGEALLRVHRIGICGTDYHAYRGRQPFFSYPRILGHELGVEVVALGDRVDTLSVGDRCSVVPYLNTARDQAVRRGFTNCGENVAVLGVHVDGGMREYLKVPAKYLHPSAQLSYEQLAVVEPLSIGCHAVNRASIRKEDYVLVVGAGPIGLGTALFAAATGAPTVLMDLNEERLNFARRTTDIAGTVVAGQEGTLELLRKQFDGDLPTVVLDATGSPQSMRQTLEYAAPAGRIVFIGLFQGDFSFPDPYFHKKELTLMASRNALPADFRQIIRMMEEGRVRTDDWITHRAPFDATVESFEQWLRPEAQVIKAVVSL